MKKTHKRWLAALLAAAMLSSGVVASADGLPKAATQSDTQTSTQADTQATNLARLDGVTATANDTETEKFPPSATIDGNYDEASRWGTNNDGKGTTERTLTLDLGAQRTINEFKVFWEKTNIRDYTIATSTNNQQWTTRVTVEGADPATEVTHTLGEAVVGRYVRLSVTKYVATEDGGSWYNVGVREFEVYGTQEVIGNLARLNGVVANASDTEVAKYPASATIDGDTSENSRWGTNNDGRGTTERILTLNLGQARTITGFKVFYEKNNIKDYVIETSSNGQQWDERVDITGNQALEPSHDLADVVTAQYVRLRVTKYGPSVPNWYNVGVREFEVYGHMPADAVNPDDQVVTLPKGTNIARQNDVIATATNVESGTTFTADKARDGDKTSTSSRWATNPNVKNPTITYNLGATYNVGSVILYWENDHADKWHVQTSMDGSDWTTQKSFDGKLVPATAPIQTINFDSIVHARYVRVWIEASSADWNNVSMYEFEVYQEASERVVTPAIAAADLAQSIQIQDGKVVMTGDVPEEYTATWGCNYEQVVDASGAIHTPLVDTKVEISVTVRETADTTVAGSATVELTIPGENSANQGNAKPAVVPELAQWYSTAAQQGKVFTLTANTRILADQQYASVAQELQADIRDLFGLNLSIVSGPAQAGDISLVYHDQAGFDKETYNMVVTDQVVIQANDAIGAYWGTRSVLQALQLSGNLTIAQGTARDYPEFENRGFMLDVGRKPTSMETLKEISKTMAWYKMNSFHVHLSDNLIFMEDYVAAGKEAEAWNSYQGYRLEYSKDGLTSKDYYYTKAEFKDFMAYSRALGVDIIPELDVPAHALSITNYIKNTLNRPDLVLNKKGGNRPWFDHVDISKQDGINIIKEIYGEYIDEDIFDENTIVHIGADEFYDSHPAYRDFLIQMIDYIRNEKDRQVRVWGSLSQMSNGTEHPFTADKVQGAQMNIWNTGWAKPQDMFNLGFDLINTIDSSLYMVPNGNGNKGGYGDWLNTQSLYNSWEPENMGGTMIPSGSAQMLGACYAIWNDNIDTRAAGINETDIYARFVDALPYLGTKMWGIGGDGLDRDYTTMKADVATLGVAPNTNPYHVIDLADGTKTYVQYTFADTQDRSGNGRNLALGPKASLADGALVLGGENSYATTGLDVAGPKNTVSMRVYKDSESNTGEQIILEADAAYGEHTVKAIANGNTWKLGFARELYEYVFNYDLPCNEWVQLTITNEGNKTKLVVNGNTYEAVGSFLPDENATTQFKGKTGITHASFDIPVARIGSKTNAFVGKVDDVTCYANGVTPTVNYLVSFNTNGGSSIDPVAVADGGKVAQPTDPAKEGYTFQGWYTDVDCTQAYDFDTEVTADITLYAKWEKDTDPAPTTSVDPDPDPTTSVDPDPDPTTSVDPDPDPTTSVDPDPDPTTSVDPDPDPTTSVDPDPDPTTSVDPDPDPTTSVDPDPDPTTSVDPQPSAPVTGGDVILDNNTDNQITVGNADKVFEANTVITVEGVTQGEIFNTVKEALKDVVADMKNPAILDITATLNGKPVQPSGKVQMTFAVPENLSVDNLKLFYVSDDGKTVEEIAITVNKDARTVTANLEHFSTYVLANVVADQGGKVPPTGDNSQLMLYVAALAISVMLMSTAVVVSRKRRS